MLSMFNFKTILGLVTDRLSNIDRYSNMQACIVIARESCELINYLFMRQFNNCHVSFRFTIHDCDASWAGADARIVGLIRSCIRINMDDVMNLKLVKI